MKRSLSLWETRSHVIRTITSQNLTRPPFINESHAENESALVQLISKYESVGLSSRVIIKQPFRGGLEKERTWGLEISFPVSRPILWVFLVFVRFLFLFLFFETSTLNFYCFAHCLSLPCMLWEDKDESPPCLSCIPAPRTVLCTQELSAQVTECWFKKQRGSVSVLV